MNGYCHGQGESLRSFRQNEEGLRTYILVTSRRFAPTEFLVNHLVIRKHDTPLEQLRYCMTNLLDQQLPKRFDEAIVFPSRSYGNPDIALAESWKA